MSNCEICNQAGFNEEATKTTSDNIPVCDRCWYDLKEQEHNMGLAPQTWKSLEEE